MAYSSLVFSPFGLSYNNYEGGKEALSSRTFPLSSITATPSSPSTVSGVGASYGVGDIVSFSTSTTAPGLVSSAYSTAVATPAIPPVSNFIMGVIEGFSYTDIHGTNVVSGYWAANTPTFNNIPPMVTINHLPNSTFMVQCNGTINTGSNTPPYGANFNLCQNGFAYTGTPLSSAVSTGANPANQQSQQFLITSGGFIGGTETLYGQCKIIGLAGAGGNTKISRNLWTDPYPIVLVRINTHFNSAPTPSSM